MKKLALALALTGAASTGAMAGAPGGKFADPVIEPPIIIEETRKSTGGIIVPILLLAIIAAVVATR